MLVLAGTSYHMLAEGLTSFDENNCVDFSGEKKENEGFRGNLFFQNSRKKLLSLNPPNCLFDLLT